MSVFSDAITGAQQAIQAVAGADVIYTRNGIEIPLRATIGKTEFSSGETETVVVTSRVRDFIVNTADLVADGEPFLPDVGDLITETAGGQVFTYQAMALANEEVWRYSDTGRNQIRIHTKEIEVA